MKTKAWNEFRETGLFTFVNVFLHIFGWAICLEFEDKKVVSVYPKRVCYNGFPQESMDKAYLRVKKFIGIYEDEEVEVDEDAIKMAEINSGIVELPEETVKFLKRTANNPIPEVNSMEENDGDGE